MYHEECLSTTVSLQDVPKWLCPRHFCVHCGSSSVVVVCRYCPTSYCRIHAEGCHHLTLLCNPRLREGREFPDGVLPVLCGTCRGRRDWVEAGGLLPRDPLEGAVLPSADSDPFVAAMERVRPSKKSTARGWKGYAVDDASSAGEGVTHDSDSSDGDPVFLWGGAARALDKLIAQLTSMRASLKTSAAARTAAEGEVARLTAELSRVHADAAKAVVETLPGSTPSGVGRYEGGRPGTSVRGGAKLEGGVAVAAVAVASPIRRPPPQSPQQSPPSPLSPRTQPMLEMELLRTPHRLPLLPMPLPLWRQ